MVQPLGLLQLVNEPTCIQPGSQSLIDHLIAQNPASQTLSNLGISDHCMIHTTWKLGNHYTPKPRIKIKYHDWHSFSQSAFQEHLKAICWKDLYAAHSVTEMLKIFNNRISSMTSKHLPTKQRFLKSPTLPPWLDQEIQASMKKCDYLKRSQV